MTTVTARAARAIGFDTFADMGLTVSGIARSNGDTVLTFAADLTPEQAQAVWDRMTSRDDADQARRAELAAQLPDADPIVASLIRYVLGLPDAPT